MHVVFDMDGVLCDTHAAVREAYRRAGVEMPNDAWGKSWDEWKGSVTHRGHQLKNDYYPSELRRRARSLHGVDILRRARWCGNAVWVLTSASQYATDAVLDFVGLRDVPVLGAGCSSLMKTTKLSNLDGGGVYVDDRDGVAPPPGWTLIHYDSTLTTEDVLKWTQ